MSERYSPWAHVQGLGDVVVAYDDLEHADAYWEPEQRVILLDRHLNQRERRACLAHELAHVDRGDEGCGDGPDGGRLLVRQERAATQLAARRLIGLDELADALAWSLDADEAAELLHVDERTARARLDGLTDAEKAYIDRRLGARDGAA